MNSPIENRRKVAEGLYGPEFNGRGGHGDERWSRMLLDYNDMRYAEVMGGVNAKSDGTPSMNVGMERENRRLPHKKHF